MSLLNLHGLSLVLCCLVVPCIALGQIDDDEFRAGLIGKYSDSQGHSFERVDTSVSLQATDGTILQRLAGDTLQVEWSGYLMSQAIGDYRLHFYGQGHVSVTLGGKPVLDADANSPKWLVSKPLPLQFDFHSLAIDYERTDAKGQLKLFWSGPGFQLEPITSRYLFHDPALSPNDSYQRGQAVVRAMRCAACHDLPAEDTPSLAPSLQYISGNLHAQWVVDWLSTSSAGHGASQRRMPHFALSRTDSEAITSYLFSQSKAAKRKPTDKKKPDVAKGKALLLATGCLACHTFGEVGSSGLFGGGDLTSIASKRPSDFFAHWLASPQELNAQHRMPVFELSKDERRDLAAFLAQQNAVSATSSQIKASDKQLVLGEQLVKQHRCLSCHAPARNVESRQLIGLADANWNDSCVDAASSQHPGFHLNSEDRRAVERYVSQSRSLPKTRPRIDAKQLLVEQNCLACHQRDDSPGLAASLPAIGAAHPELAVLIPAMTPPPLISVGDKLYDQSIQDAILRKSVHRDYLQVRMPKFNLTDKQLQSLTQYFVDSDRIPPLPQPLDLPSVNPIVLHTVGSRLVTTDGFGCTSCHQLGSVQPAKAPLAARGPQLTLLAKRIRREWFERFVRNPLRVIPRMEMPSVQVAVPGILDDDLDVQLAAVWDVLNTPGFEPPLPNPVRVVRRSGIAQRGERSVVITDVVRDGKLTFVKPLLLGLPNRSNFLFDLERAALVQWSVGDVAHERTEGKTWFWATAGTPLLTTGLAEPELTLINDTSESKPLTTRQFVTEFDEISHTDAGGIEFRYRLVFGDQTESTVAVTQTWEVVSHETDEVQRTLQLSGLPKGSKLQLQLLDSSLVDEADRDGSTLQTEFGVLRVEDNIAISEDFSISIQAGQEGKASATIAYTPRVPIDVIPTLSPTIPSPQPSTLNVVPGFETVRLPIHSEFMPTALDWRPSGDLVVASLKGRVWNLSDTDADGLEDKAVAISDELAAPYGVAAYDDFVDVVTKYGLLRLRPNQTQTIASGWGHTTDYHDWVVGLPRDSEGNYYLALPCQQDKRSAAAAKFKGSVLRLEPRKPTAEDPRLFGIEELTAGHRFPMGIARNRAGEMFVTDNQGNYNPFNELNHVVAGKRFGFINAIDRKPDFNPPLTPPAINIPHPWTRSVNGICFLESPDADSASFGPFEGHLVGCEYDTRRLIRMSLQRVGDTYQGAAYPFSYDQPKSGPPLLGPLVCAVSPTGDLYVGGIRDSGWGGSNNIGELVRLRADIDRLPCGIGEVTATSTGFRIKFTRPIERAKASRLDNYSIASYTRTSTPAYGGTDQDRRQEKVGQVTVSKDGTSVDIVLGQWRQGYVYEIHLKSLATGNDEFFPAEAHYSLNVIPD